jgi:hypothetical protein
MWTPIAEFIKKRYSSIQLDYWISSILCVLNYIKQQWEVIMKKVMLFSEQDQSLKMCRLSMNWKTGHYRK